MKLILNFLLLLPLWSGSQTALSHGFHRNEIQESSETISHTVGLLANPAGIFMSAYNFHNAYTHSSTELRTLILLYNSYDFIVHAVNFLSFALENQIDIEDYMHPHLLNFMNILGISMHPLHVIFLEKENFIEHILNFVEAAEFVGELNNLAHSLSLYWKGKNFEEDSIESVNASSSKQIVEIQSIH